MADPTERAKKGDLDPVYVLASDHPILLDRALAAIRDAAVPPAMRGWNYDVVEGSIKGAGAGSRIVAIARTLPMMAERRMVFVRDLAPLPADEAPHLVEYFADPNPSTVLVAITSKIDKRQKLYAAAGKHGFLHVLEAPRQVAPWIRGEAQARGVALDARAVTRLADAVGADLSRLALVIEQLSLYCWAGGTGPGAGAGKPVTADDVDDLVADTRERSVFELTDAVGAGDLPGALAAVQSLCDQRDSAIGVISMLARHLRQLGVVLAHRGGGKGAIASALGLPPFIADKLIAQARHYTPEGLARATMLLAAADRALKGDQLLEGRLTGFQMKALGRDLGERVVLERVVTSIVGEAS
jgi:DNA polymerase-3 subunit delta